MIELPCIVIDSETTGLASEPMAAVVEVAAVVVQRDGTIPFSVSTLVNPFSGTRPITASDEAMAVHGIAEDDILRAPVAGHVDMALDLVREHVLPTFAPDWPFNGLRWTSWRLDFDATLLGRDFPRLTKWPRATCIHAYARSLVRDGELHDDRSPSLRMTAAALGIPMPATRHRALADALLAAEVLHALVTRAPDAPLEVSHVQPVH